MISKDYKGPVSGRITIGGGDNPEIKRESFTQAQDPVLSKDERRATEWFRALPPNEQYREVRRLKWNADARAKAIEADHTIIVNQNEEIVQLRRELAGRRPDGFEIPMSASVLLDHAKAHGWRTGKAWSPVTFYDDEGHEQTDPDEYRLQIGLAGHGWEFKLIWSCQPGGRGHVVMGHSLARGPYRAWHDAPSLTKIKKIIEEEARDHD
jgi:hypothetical protein